MATVGGGGSGGGRDPSGSLEFDTLLGWEVLTSIISGELMPNVLPAFCPCLGILGGKCGSVLSLHVLNLSSLRSTHSIVQTSHHLEDP